jgi:hypothetical protein
MSGDSISRNCPTCGGTEFCLGRPSRQHCFVPDTESWLTLVPAIPYGVFVCLTCGFLGD